MAYPPTNTDQCQNDNDASRPGALPPTNPQPAQPSGKTHPGYGDHPAAPHRQQIPPPNAHRQPIPPHR